MQSVLQSVDNPCQDPYMQVDLEFDLLCMFLACLLFSLGRRLMIYSYFYLTKKIGPEGPIEYMTTITFYF